MRLFTWPLDSDEYPLCSSCAPYSIDSSAAKWRETKPSTLECGCGAPAHIEEHQLPNPPTKPRLATLAEQRAIGFSCEGDDLCEECGLWSIGGQYPVCEGCGACSGCGCKCGTIKEKSE
jgi:hypothetical protein